MPVTSKKKLEIEERRKKVAANILGGLNYRDIATALKVGIGTVSSDMKVITQRFQEDQDQAYASYVVVEVRRLDVALNAIWDKVVKGNAGAIELMMRIQDQRAKLLAHPSAVRKIELTGKDGGPVSIEDVRSRRWQQIADQLTAMLATSGETDEVALPDLGQGDTDVPNPTIEPTGG